MGNELFSWSEIYNWLSDCNPITANIIEQEDLPIITLIDSLIVKMRIEQSRSFMFGAVKLLNAFFDDGESESRKQALKFKRMAEEQKKRKSKKS